MVPGLPPGALWNLSRRMNYKKLNIIRAERNAN